MTKDGTRNLVFKKSNWFLAILLLIFVICLAWLRYILGSQIFTGAVGIILRSMWVDRATIILLITAFVIGYQAYYTKKYTELAVAPSVFFILRSNARLMLEAKFQHIMDAQEKEKIIDEELNKLSLTDRLATYFIIKNNSSFPVLFQVKINYKGGKNKIPRTEHYWVKPLYVYPPGMRYPNVIDLQSVLDKYENGSNIIAEITYTYHPRFASEIYYGEFSEIWTYDMSKFRWIGLDGAREENLTVQMP